MKLFLNDSKEVDAKFIKVSALVRYWEDAQSSEVEEVTSDNFPFANGDLWEPLIDIDKGLVVDWPEGVSANVHFKVVDCGCYYLLDKEQNVISSIENNYVPDGLCHGDNGYGDYIIFSIDSDGNIEDYKQNIDPDDWNNS